MKTAVTVLQEMMVKLGEAPEYECISQSGPQHSAVFEFRCKALGCLETAVARSKKEAKQEVARRMLATLSARGEPVPPPYNQTCHVGQHVTDPNSSTSMGGIGGGGSGGGVEGGKRPIANSFVALLRELCEEYRLPAIDYELVADTGPAHLRQFTMRAQLGQHQRLATASTKKAARQLAAQQLYTYLRDNLARLTTDFVEEEALARAHDRVMDRYVKLTEEAVWRPNLGQRVADYHLGLITQIEAEKCNKAKDIADIWFESEAQVDNAESTFEEAAATLGLSCGWTLLPTETSALQLLTLSPASPALAWAGVTRAAAASQALQHLRLALQQPKLDQRDPSPSNASGIVV